MRGKGDAYERYRVHGDDVDSLWIGFQEIGMPDSRRREALAIVREIVEANDAHEFRWYKTEGKAELCCYWDHLPVNVLWITPTNVHIKPDARLVRQPSRPTNWSEDREDAAMGWLLPGAEPGTGGARHKPKPVEVLCPATFMRIPAGSVCPECEVIHGE